MKIKTTRRTFLKTSGTLAFASAAFASALLPLRARAATARGEAKKFQHGVASGDPLAESVILWTRIALSQEKERVLWQVAHDDKFKSIIKMGETETSKEQDGIVKFDCDGLKAGTTYYYRFLVKGETSPIGRTKTLPRGKPDKIKLGVCSCANYNAGYFTAYRALANTSDLDAVIHLGDYIYEYGDGVYGKHPMRSIKPKGEILTLTDYRTRYAHYRSDGDLQKLHAAHPMIAVWDDHEVANNGWKKGAQNHSAEEGSYKERQRAARQAYFEWLPIRSPIRHGNNKKIYRRFLFGDLAALIMIDTRYDARQKELTLGAFIKKEKNKTFFDKKLFDKKVFNPKRMIMSRAQSLWLKNSLYWAKRKARWTLLGNQIPFNPVYMTDVQADKNSSKIIQSIARVYQLAKKAGLKKVPVSLDEWSGFPIAQQTLVRQIQKADNPTLVLTGDTHNGWACFYGNDDEKVGIELGTPGISSDGIEAFIPKSSLENVRKNFLKANPSSIFRDLTHRGFMVLEVERQQATTKWLWADVGKRRGRITAGPTLKVARLALDKPELKA